MRQSLEISCRNVECLDKKFNFTDTALTYLDITASAFGFSLLIDFIF